MTDREALEDLLRRFGLTPYTGHGKDWDSPDPPGDNQVKLVAKEGGVEGYGGFLATFEFDADGKFESLHLWE